MKNVLLIIRRGRKFRVGFYNKLYNESRGEFKIDFLFTHPIDFDRTDTVFDYKISKERYFFGLKKEAMSLDLNIKNFIKKETDIVVLPAPDHPLSTFEFLKAYKKSKRMGKKTVLWWNPPSWEERIFKKIWWKIRKIFVRGAFQNLDSIVTYCDQGKKTFINEYGVQAKKIFVAQNSLDNEEVIKKSKKFLKNKQRIIKEYGLEDKKVILFLGKITVGKNLDSLLIAMVRVLKEEKNSVLLIVGDGDYRGNLEVLAKELRIEKKVLFLGENKKDPEKIINIADVAVMPGLGGLSLNHIMLCGKPVISSKADGTPLDLIEDGKNGFILEKETSEEIATKILYLLKNDSKRLKMGENAASSVKQKANLDLMVEHFIQALKNTK